MPKPHLDHISVHGKVPKDDSRLIAKAVLFYARHLLSRQMMPHVSVIIKLRRKFKKDIEGDCEIIGYGRKDAPRHFMIRALYDEKLGIGKTLSVIAHEMVHIKQFATGQVDPMLTTWEGTKYSEDVNYWDHPWEIDAYGRQVGLYTRFVKKYKLSPQRLQGEKVCKKR